MTSLPRRAFLAGGAGLALARSAVASPDSVRAWLEARAPKPAVPGRVRLALPDLADNGASVQVALAVDGPADAVRALHLAADGNPNPGIASFRFGEGIGRAEVATRIRLAQSQRVTAVAELADGSAWSATREVKVTLGGCGVGEPEIASGPPTARVRVPSPARRGEIVEIRTLVTHPMESGERRDASGARIPRKILREFACRYGGRELLSATLEPAIAANPYLVFFATIDRAAEFEFSWTDDDGSVVRAAQAVTLA